MAARNRTTDPLIHRHALRAPTDGADGSGLTQAATKAAMAALVRLGECCHHHDVREDLGSTSRTFFRPPDMIQVYAFGYATNGTTRKGKFLTALAAGSSVAAAASAAGIGRSSAYRWRDDPAFADPWDNAEEEGVDLLEDAARVRALSPDMPGSTATLLFLLRHRRPERYRPPPASAAAVSLAPDDLRAVEEHRRI